MKFLVAYVEVPASKISAKYLIVESLPVSPLRLPSMADT